MGNIIFEIKERDDFFMKNDIISLQKEIDRLIQEAEITYLKYNFIKKECKGDLKTMTKILQLIAENHTRWTK